MTGILKLLLMVVGVLAMTSPALAQGPTDPIDRFGKAKAIARDKVYHDHTLTFYCRCDYTPRGASGGTIDSSDCGYAPRKINKRSTRVEWEHVVPASRLAGARQCWTTGHPQCTKKGRRCCEKTGVDDEARHMINDLHNLVPSVGELNADRSNHPYGIVDEEPRQYGSCNFEVGGSTKVAEPAEALRGNVARIWLYMDETYGLSLSNEEVVQFETWSQEDPVGDWELERDGRIMNIQGNSNPLVAEADEEE